MSYACPVCGINDPNAYLRCIRPDCLDGRDPRPAPKDDATGLVERLAGPHEWGYRDPVVGGFIEDDTPFRAATRIEEQEREVGELQSMVNELEMQLNEARVVLETHNWILNNLLTEEQLDVINPKTRKAIRFGT